MHSSTANLKPKTLVRTASSKQLAAAWTLRIDGIRTCMGWGLGFRPEGHS